MYQTWTGILIPEDRFSRDAAHLICFCFQSFFDSHQGELACVQLPKDGEVTNNPAVGIVNMIRSGYLALQLLPENSSAGKI